MNDTFRICPDNRMLIERHPGTGDYWLFYMITDSPNEAKRIVALLNARAEQVTLIRRDEQ